MEGVNTAVRIPVTDPSRVSEARRAGARLAAQLGLPETESGRLAIVVTEAATNLLKHSGGGGGVLLLSILERAGVCELLVLALDNGPGMANVAECLEDGYSSSGSPGTGLGAIQRLAAESDIYSLPGHGTAILARFRPLPAGPVAVAGFSVPLPGEPVCGDAWAVRETEAGPVLMVVDGLGHGAPAAEAARSALAAFHSAQELDPVALLERLNLALRSTRGASLAVCAIHPAAGLVRYAGVGNIAGVIEGGGRSRHLVSMNGTAGHAVRGLKMFEYPAEGGSVVVLHSDGVSARWDLKRYPGLLPRSPAMIAGVLYRDHGRPRDDSTVVVARVAGADPV